MAEVAELLKLNQQTVRNWIDQGSLPALKVGRRVRIRRSDFERMLEQGTVKGSDAPSDERAGSAEAFWGGEPVGLAESPGSQVAERRDLTEPAGSADGEPVAREPVVPAEPTADEPTP